MTTDFLSGKQDNSHPDWFSSQIILSWCDHGGFNVPSEIPGAAMSWGDAGAKRGTGHSRTRAAVLGPAAG